MSNTVWVVTSGSYSDYSINAVCSTEENAKLIAAKLYDANDPLEIELDKFVSQLSLGKTYYRAWVFRDQRPIKVASASPAHDDPQGFEMWPNWNAAAVYLWADNEEDAIKIAADKRAQWLAEEAYGANPR